MMWLFACPCTQLNVHVYCMCTDMNLGTGFSSMRYKFVKLKACLAWKLIQFIRKISKFKFNCIVFIGQQILIFFRYENKMCKVRKCGYLHSLYNVYIYLHHCNSSCTDGSSGLKLLKLQQHYTVNDKDVRNCCIADKNYLYNK